MKTFSNPILILLVFTLLSVNSGCNYEVLRVGEEHTVSDLLNGVRSQIGDIVNFSKSKGNARTIINPENPENPYDYYGFNYAYITENYNTENYYNQYGYLGYETVRDEYLNAISSYLSTQNIFMDMGQIVNIEQQLPLLDLYGIEYFINNAYYNGRISYATKEVILAYYNYYEHEEVNAYAFNEISLIFENSISQSQALSDYELEQTLSIIAISKYDNALNAGYELARKGCLGRAVGAMILGFLLGGPQAAFIATAIASYSCLFLE